jgi:ATP-dependent RNA helicase DOB1
MSVFRFVFPLVKEIFTSSFEEVGLMTGDVILNPNAPCLIMTTEILRSMLYNGSETLSETSVVIFDEIHYMKDVERGIIWEESIIMLPPEVQCLFLSATLSNSQEFAEWIHEIKSSPHRASLTTQQQQAASAAAGTAAPVPSSSVVPSSVSAAVHHSATCHVVYTNTRPIPLTHYMFLKGGAGIYQIKNDRLIAKQAAAAAQKGVHHNNHGAIITANLNKIHAEMLRLEKAKAAEKSSFSDLIKQAANRSALTSATSSPAHHTSKIHAQLSVARAAKRSHVPDVIRLISLCVEQKWLPAIFFSFSRRECEGLSLVAIGDKWRLDLTTPEEKECITMVWNRAMEGLDGE